MSQNQDYSMTHPNYVVPSPGVLDLERSLIVGATPWKAHIASHRHLGVISINSDPFHLL
jgi:hypothetical protein